jgi:beta-glucanase (GH16 family)
MNKNTSCALVGAFFLGALSLFAQGATPATISDEPSEAAFVVSRREEAPTLPSNQKRALKPGFSSEGIYASSGTHKTPLGNSLYSTQPGSAFWNPLLTIPGRYRVSAYKIVSGKSDDPAVAFTINHSGKKSSASMDSTQGSTEWVVLGEYDFSADRDEFVQHVRTAATPEKILTRISDIRFDRIDASGKIEDSLIVTVDHWLPRYLNVEGVKGHRSRQEITTMVRKGFASLLPDGTFAPDAPISSGDFLAWAVATASGDMPASPEKTLAKADKLGISETETEQFLRKKGVTGQEAATLLATIAQAKGRSLAGIPGHVAEASGKNLTRAEAAVTLRRFLHLVLAPNPPPGGDWQLAFEDRFDKPALDESVWTIDNSVRVRNRLGRWRENVEVRDGHLRLLNKVESRDGCIWSSGNLMTKGEWQYGYFEASYRYARSVGINNAFWGFSRPTDNPRVELNPNEGWYPDIINSHFYIHHKKGGKTTPLTNGTRDGSLLGYRTGENLADDFHVLGMEWNEKELIFYFDGREIRRLPNIDAHRPIAVWFSTYIADWCGGKATRSVDGTFMEIDWVRVWQKSPGR